MKIKFQFNSKSSGQGVPEAISLAKKCGGYLDNKFYVIEFDDPKDRNLGKLFDLVGNLKGSVIMLDDGEPINAGQFFYAVYCQDKLLCKGICKHMRLEYYPVDEFTKAHISDIEGDILKTSNTNLFRQLTDFLEPISDTQFQFNKSLFLEFADSFLTMERQFCEKFDFDKFTEFIQTFPSKIELISSEELEFEDTYEEQYEEEQGIAYILPECDIDNLLPFESIIRCSKAISLLSRFTKPSRISNSNISIYSYPEINKIIFVKLQVKDVNSYAEEQEVEEEKTYVIKDHQGFFIVKNDLFELFFQIYEDSDPSIENQFKYLRNL